MATSRLRVIIDASANAAIASINAVGKAVDAMGDNTTRTGRVTEAAFAGLGRTIGLATKAVAVGWTTAAVAVGGTAIAAFKTGMEFNTLQQKANASFTTILGSAKAADKMMASISKFADTSPFPRQVFIEAAQRMVAFGIAADDVVPIMSAVQDAVAAAGGSSQDISEITFVLGQIQAAGKITGQDLMQLGQRGINAAELIGKATGKTGKQIKEDISNGALSADDAIAALTKGMAEKFAGAAQNVKKTWVGTTDSIKAALRDIGAAMSAPFIDPKGGGLFVEWGNTVAEILRSVRDLVRQIMPQIMSDFGGSFDSIGAILDKINGALKNVNFDEFAAKIKTVAPVLGLLTGAFASMSSGLLGNVPVIGQMLTRLSGPFGMIVLAIAGLVATSPELQKAFGQTLAATLKAIEPAVTAIGDALIQLVPFLTQVIQAVLPLVPAIATLASNFLSALLPPMMTIITTALPPLITGLEFLANVLADVMANQGVANVLAAIAGGLLAIGAASKAVGLVTGAIKAMRAAALGTRIGLMALKVQQIALGVASKVAAAAQWLFNAAMSANPVMLVVAAIALLVAGFVLLWHNSEAFRNFFIGMWAGIKAAALATWSAIKTAALAVWSAIQTAATAVWSVLTSIWNMLANAGTSVWNAIRGVAVTVFNVIRTVAQVVFNAIMAYVRAYLAVFRAVFNAARAVAQAVFYAIRAVVAAVINAVKAYLSGMLAVARAVFNAVRSVASVAFNAVRSVVSSVVGSVKSIIRTISATASSVFGAIRSTASSVFGAIRTIVSGAVNGVKAVIRTLSATFSSVFGHIKSIVSSAMGVIKGVVSGAVSTIKGVIDGIASAFSSAFSRAKSIASGAISFIKGLIGGVSDALSGVMSFIDRVKSAIGRIKVPGILKKVLGRAAPASAAAMVPTGYGTLTPPSTNTNRGVRAGDLQGAVGGLVGAVARLGQNMGGDVRVINVSVSGAMDPVAVARQIDSVLTRSERRRGGVRVGRGPTS